MPPRLYAPQLPTTGTVTLERSEAHHAKNVLRLAPGDQVELFDGRGLTAIASIIEFFRHELVCEISHFDVQPEQRPGLTLATAVPKGERFDWLVEKATELGVRRVIPLQTERSTVDPRDAKLARLRQTIIAACKQSRRVHLMELADVMPWARLLKTYGGELMVAHPGGMPLSQVPWSSDNELVVAVGPEGGFTAGEMDAAATAGCRMVGLGRNLLRIETAAIAVAAFAAVQRTTK